MSFNFSPLPFIFIASLLLDRLCGDPRWRLHPVRLMGNLALCIEPSVRRIFRDRRLAGVAAGTFVITLFAYAAAVITIACGLLHPLLADTAAAVLLYFSIAPHDLAAHARAIAAALDRDDLPAARQAVGMIVGRDTEPLDEQGVARAAIESVAENLVDGVVSAMFWALAGWGLGMFLCRTLLSGHDRAIAAAAGIAGGAFAFRAVNTLDATFGYRSARYISFGWFSAKIDDAANLPAARLFLPLAFAAAWMLRQRPVHGLRTCLRDHAKHSSPNSAWPEAFFAGSLGIRLGGPVTYKGRLHDYQFLGDALEEPVTGAHVSRAIDLMLLTSWLAAGACALAVWILTYPGS